MRERSLRLCYERSILKVEHGPFTPLDFSAASGMGTAATVNYKRLASILPGREAWTAIVLEDHNLDQIQSEFSIAEILHHLHLWLLIINQACLPRVYHCN
jgi:hypothetical protein